MVDGAYEWWVWLTSGGCGLRVVGVACEWWVGLVSGGWGL